jgi:phosphoglycerate-specific signal transduction histidine kinase
MKYKQLKQLVQNINAVIENQETKVAKKLVKVYEKVKKYHEDYNSQLEELRLDNASVDEKGILVLTEKGDYKFSKEGIKKLTKDIETLNDKEFDFVIINVVNPQGLEDFTFLEDWTTGIEFNKQEDIEL